MPMGVAVASIHRPPTSTRPRISARGCRQRSSTPQTSRENIAGSTGTSVGWWTVSPPFGLTVEAIEKLPTHFRRKPHRTPTRNAGCGRLERRPRRDARPRRLPGAACVCPDRNLGHRGHQSSGHRRVLRRCRRGQQRGHHRRGRTAHSGDLADHCRSATDRRRPAALRWSGSLTSSDANRMSGPDVWARAPRSGATIPALYRRRAAPIWRPEARGILQGLSLATGSAELAQAMMRGVALSDRHVIETAMRGSGLPEVYLGGAAAATPEWVRVRLEAFGTPAHLHRELGMAALGAYILAASAEPAGGSSSFPPDPLRRMRYRRRRRPTRTSARICMTRTGPMHRPIASA